MYLVSSLPKSGTRYMTSVLQSLGVVAIHEHVPNKPGQEALVSSIHHDSFACTPPHDYDFVIHLVRHPLAWAHGLMRDGTHFKSWDRLGTPLLRFSAVDRIPEGRETGEVMLLMTWLRGHEWIENVERPAFWVRIEDMGYPSRAKLDLIRFLGLKAGDVPAVKWDHSHTSTGGQLGDPWTRDLPPWPVVPGYEAQIEAVRRKAIQYGYY